MTEFDRRDIVKLFTGLAVIGAFSKPKTAAADGGITQILNVLIVGVIVISYIYLILVLQVFLGTVKTARVVKDGSHGKPSTARRLGRARKCGAVKLQGDGLFASLNKSCGKSLAGKRSVNISIPLPATGESMELKMRLQNKKKAAKVLAAAKAGGKTVGSVHQDADGLIFNIRKAGLG